MMTVYIPSRGRVENIRQCLRAWWLHDVDARVVVAKEDMAAYSKAMAEESETWQRNTGSPPENTLIQLPKGVAGMGAIRAFIVNHANEHLRYKSFIMSDDDIIPHHSANPQNTLLMSATSIWEEHDSIPLGVGCVVSQHDLLLGDEEWRLRKSDPIFCSSGYGFRMFAINTKAALEIGNFEPKLDVCFEDAEFMRQGLLHGYTWWLDPLLRAVPLGKRFAAGGIEALASSADGERQRRTDECHRLVADRWPGFMSAPGKAPRFQWKKLIDECIPDWRDLYMS